MIEEGELPIRGFYWSSKAWYAEGAGITWPEVNFGLYYRHDGTTGEMSMKWEKLGGELVPRLCIFSDAWKTLASFKDLLDELSNVDNKNISDAEFVEIIKKCGFEDLTKYYNPEEAADAAKKTDR
jgi:hypothetical protein